jgi:hypothetical protein
MTRRGAAVLLCVALSAAASDLDLARPRDPAPQSTRPCTSVVLQRCTPSTDAAREPGDGELRQRRAAPNLDRVLEAVVIEGDRLPRPPTVAEAIESATARRSSRSFESGDGGQCTCIKPCPAWPAPCCACTKGGRDAMINNLLK